MSNSELDTGFVIAKEPTWLSSVEWGLICSFTFIIIDYFLSSHFSTWAMQAVNIMSTVSPPFVCFLAVKEIRDKKLQGRITFWYAFIFSLHTGITLSVVNLGWAFLMYPVDESTSLIDVTFSFMISHVLLFVLVSLIVGAILRRKL